MIQPVTNVLNSNAFQRCADVFFTAKYIAVNNQKTVCLQKKKALDVCAKASYGLHYIFKCWVHSAKLGYELHYIFKCWVHSAKLGYELHYIFKCWV